MRRWRENLADTEIGKLEENEFERAWTWMKDLWTEKWKTHQDDVDASGNKKRKANSPLGPPKRRRKDNYQSSESECGLDSHSRTAKQVELKIPNKKLKFENQL